MKKFILIVAIMFVVGIAYLITEENKEGEYNFEFFGSNSKVNKNANVDKVKNPLKELDEIEQKKLSQIEKINPYAAQDLKDELDALRNGYGSTPPVDKLDTPNVQSIIEAIKTKKYPERLSISILPKDFDNKAFENDSRYRKKYLDVVEPGRILQVRQPGKGVPKIERISPYYQTVRHGEKVSLKVKGLPNKPISIASYDLGAFGNGLTAQTLLADNQGIAEFFFHGVQGTIADTNIVCSCPLTSGKIKFIVNTKKKAPVQNP